MKKIFDLINNEMIQKLKAHDGPIYSMDMHPSQNSIATAGGDACVKIWEFDLTMIDNRKQLTVRLIRTLKLQDEALAVKYSPNR